MDIEFECSFFIFDYSHTLYVWPTDRTLLADSIVRLSIWWMYLFMMHPLYHWIFSCINCTFIGGWGQMRCKRREPVVRIHLTRWLLKNTLCECQYPTAQVVFAKRAFNVAHSRRYSRTNKHFLPILQCTRRGLLYTSFTWRVWLIIFGIGDITVFSRVILPQHR